MSKLHECGAELKTRTCTRAPLWPGGRCPRHGYGAETLAQWIRGLAMAEAAAQEARRSGSMPTSVNLDLSIYARAEWVEHDDDDDLRFTNSACLEWREEVPAHARLIVKWSASTRRTTIMSGELDVDAAAVLADTLEVGGLADDRHVEQLREQIVLIVRAKLRRDGANAEAAAAAAQVRDAGVFALAVDDMLVIPRDSIEALVAALGLADG